MHRKVAAALVAALALAVAGCGGAEPLTRAQLVRQIETACRDGQQETQRALRAVRGSSDASRKQFVAAIVGGQRSVVESLDDLEASDAAKSSFDSFKEAVRERADLFGRVESAADGEVQRAMTAVQAKSEGLTRRIQQAASRLGIEGCV